MLCYQIISQNICFQSIKTTYNCIALIISIFVLLFLRFSNMKLDDSFDIDAIGDDHISSSSDTPLRDDAFALSKSEKINA